MSRNVRHKTSVTPTKKSVKRRSQSYDSSSDDDDYAGVDLVSDSEDDEPDVEGVEERAIIESEEEEDRLHITPRPHQEHDQKSWNGFEIDIPSNHDTFGETFFDDHMARTQAAEEGTACPDSDDEPVRKNVRFDISDSSDDEDENYGFPDLFVPQENLDASFLRQIETEDDQLSETFWDFNNEKDPHLYEGEDGDSNSSATYSSFSDESEDGEYDHDGDDDDDDDDETDEETWGPVAKTADPRSVLRRPSTDSEPEEEITIARRALPRTPGRPRLIDWVTTPDKPFAVINNSTKKIVMFKAKLPPRPHTSEGLPRPQNNTPGLLPSAMDCSEELSPMISNSANLMMSALYTPIDESVGDQALGPPEAFFPFVDISANGHMSQDTPSFDGEEEDLDGENGDVWVGDFLNFEPDTDEDIEAEVEPEDSGSTTNDEIFSTPRPTTASSEDQVHPMLVNPSLVGAFRTNQYRHKIMSRDNATTNSLLFSGPLAHTAVRGIKHGRLAAAAVPISPLRKKKVSDHEALSPLATQTKRKFSGEQQKSHKRSKSIN